DLFRELVADLDCRNLALFAFFKRSITQNGYAADAVEARAGAKEHHLVAGTGSKSQLQILHAQGTHAQCVDQWVTSIRLIKDGLAADVRQAQRVTIAADAGNNARQNTRGIRGISWAEEQPIHHCGDRK